MLQNTQREYKNKINKKGGCTIRVKHAINYFSFAICYADQFKVQDTVGTISNTVPNIIKRTHSPSFSEAVRAGSFMLIALGCAHIYNPAGRRNFERDEGAFDLHPPGRTKDRA